MNEGSDLRNAERKPNALLLHEALHWALVSELYHRRLQVDCNAA